MPKEQKSKRLKKEAVALPQPPDNVITVYKDELEKHLAQKCNSRPRPNPPYFSLDVNCTLSSPSKSTKEETTSLSELSKEILDSLINNVNYWFQTFVPTNFKKTDDDD
ncbi:4110_t:CDS:2, partial [Racocetra fulgida]